MNKEMISAAQMYALGCISIEDVCYLLHCNEDELPASFYSYANLYAKKYEIDMKLKELTVSI